MDSNIDMSFSVLMSIYSKENPDYLKLALMSIWINQTLKPNEIIIIKDGPLTMELEEVLSDFAQIAPIKFFENKQNLGLSSSLRIGISHCTKKYVARMDTDDICSHNRFERQISFLKENPMCDIVGTYAMKIDALGLEHGLIKVPTKNNDIYKLIWTSPFIHPSVLFKKDCIINVGSYNPNSGPRQDDYELWFRCAAAGYNFANIPEPLLNYRFYADSLKKNNITVGWHRFKVGFKGCRKLHCSFYAYLGITFPLIRSILPYPMNMIFNKFMELINPRNE